MYWPELQSGRFRVYIHVYEITEKSRWGEGIEENLEMFLLRKGVTLPWLVNSNMVNLEKFDHLHVVYYFTIPLNKSIAVAITDEGVP